MKLPVQYVFVFAQYISARHIRREKLSLNHFELKLRTKLFFSNLPNGDSVEQEKLPHLIRPKSTHRPCP